jgi:putative Mn2+ efflux pump MntP
MNYITVVLIAVGLSADAFSVAICKGIALKKPTLSHMGVIGLYFGVFQAVMPVIGYFLADALGGIIDKYVERYSGLITFVILAFLGIKMIVDSFSKGEDGKTGGGHPLAAGEMFSMAVATSIDALAIGVSFRLEHIDILFPALIIGVMTFALSAAGAKIGSVFGAKYQSKAEIAGGIILIGIGLYSFIESII